MLLSRREFLQVTAGGILTTACKTADPIVMSVNGPVKQDQLGKTLIHEHFIVDFIGADKISYDRWNRNDVIKKVIPYLQEVHLNVARDSRPVTISRTEHSADLKLLLNSLQEVARLYPDAGW